MKTFVILAAGRGTRIGRTGEYLHKALVPLGGKAVLSHLLDLVPPGARVVVCTGYRSEQIEDYLRMAHPNSGVKTVHVDGWDAPGVGGPGWSLLAARPHIEGDLIFTSCDTLWDPVPWGDDSWLGVAPLPAGTPPERWCRVVPNGHGVDVLDKRPTPAGGWVHTGMGQIAERSLTEFWHGLEQTHTVQGERQMSAGFRMVSDIACRTINWTDVGDAEAYHRAVTLMDGYDWSKTNEATYLLPEQRRVVKFHSDPQVARAYQARSIQLGGAVPQVLDFAANWTATAYMDGLPPKACMPLVLEWAEANLWRPTPAPSYDEAEAFYHGKVNQRVGLLSPDLQYRARSALDLVHWDTLLAGGRPSVMHGDLTFGNMLRLRGGGFTSFDWRPSPVHWGDKRYDLAKLWSGCRVDWERARRGDFRPPLMGPADEKVLADYCARKDITGVPVIAGLCLLSSAPMHPTPFDEVLVTRGVRLLEEFACA